MKFLLGLVLLVAPAFGVENDCEKAFYNGFTNNYAIESCSPDCSKILVGDGIPLTKINLLRITVRNSEKVLSCTGEMGFEYNLGFYPIQGESRYYWYNNFGGGSTYSVCDSRLSVTETQAELKSLSGLSLTLKRDGEKFDFEWIDPKLGMKAQLKLRALD